MAVGKTMEEIIDFAIKREQEAVHFYQELQVIVSFKGKEALLKELEEMEKGHIRVLEGIRTKSIQNLSIPNVENLVISESLEEIPPTADMSYQDILITAMKREESASKLYGMLAEEVVDDNIKRLFQRLAAEEAGHKLYFEKIYDKEILTEN